MRVDESGREMGEEEGKRVESEWDIQASFYISHGSKNDRHHMYMDIRT